MRKVYIIKCVDLNYICAVFSSLKTARLAKRWYHEVIGKKQHIYIITTKTLFDSGFNSFFDIPID